MFATAPYSTVTDFARVRGLSTSVQPFDQYGNDIALGMAPTMPYMALLSQMMLFFVAFNSLVALLCLP